MRTLSQKSHKIYLQTDTLNKIATKTLSCHILFQKTIVEYAAFSLVSLVERNLFAFMLC